jgi:hypothetical protein
MFCALTADVSCCCSLAPAVISGTKEAPLDPSSVGLVFSKWDKKSVLIAAIFTAATAAASGTKEAPLDPALDLLAAVLPPVTMVFACVEGGKQFAAYNRKVARLVNEVIVECASGLLRQVGRGWTSAGAQKKPLQQWP